MRRRWGLFLITVLVVLGFVGLIHAATLYYPGSDMGIHFTTSTANGVDVADVPHWGFTTPPAQCRMLKVWKDGSLQNLNDAVTCLTCDTSQLYTDHRWKLKAGEGDYNFKYECTEECTSPMLMRTNPEMRSNLHSEMGCVDTSAEDWEDKAYDGVCLTPGTSCYDCVYGYYVNADTNRCETACGDEICAGDETQANCRLDCEGAAQ